MDALKIDEIINNLYTSDFNEPLYVWRDEEVLTQPRLIRRANGGNGDRYYWTLSEGAEGNKIKFFVSTTTFVKKVLPTSSYLIEWMKKEGEEADKIRDLAADYGTLMHICIGDFLVNGYDFNLTGLLVAKYLEKLGHPRYLIGKWTTQLNRHMASFKHFYNEYEIEPILIEGMLASDELGIAGALDLICFMRTPEQKKAYIKALKAYDEAVENYPEAVEKYNEKIVKYESAVEKYKKALDKFNLTLENGTADLDKMPVAPKKPEAPAIPVKPEVPTKIKAQVDFKSGGIYESSAFQLAINKMIFQENFPGFELDRIFNWSPSDWKIQENPTFSYTLKDQTENIYDYEFISSALYMYNKMYKNEIADKKVSVFSGEITTGYQSVSDNVRVISLLQSIEEQINNSKQA